jgi:hypothetical protein
MSIRLSAKNAVSASVVDAAVAEAIEAHTPGIELGFAERTTSFVSGNADITTFSVGPITGQGRPVDITYFCPAVYHTVANTLNRADLKVSTNGGAAAVVNSGWIMSTATTVGPSMRVTHRMLFASGSTYTVTVGVFQGTAGTMTWFASASPNRPMQLSVTSR